MGENICKASGCVDGACCITQAMGIAPNEWPQFSRDIPVGYYEETSTDGIGFAMSWSGQRPDTDPGYAMLSTDESGSGWHQAFFHFKPCHKLKDGQCSDYENRPQACRRQKLNGCECIAARNLMAARRRKMG